MTTTSANLQCNNPLLNQIVKYILPLLFLFLFFNPCIAALSQEMRVRKFEFQNKINQTNDYKNHIILATEAGDWFVENDEEETALIFYKQASKKAKEQPNSTLYAQSLIKLADFTNNPYISRFQYIKAKEIYEQQPSNYQREIANIIEKLVWTYDVLNKDLNLAIELLLNANHIRSQLPYEDAYTENIRALAWLYEYKGDLATAENYLSLAQNLEMKHLGFNDIRTVLSMENFALFYIKQANYPKAIAVLQKKYQLHRKSKFIDYYNLGRTESMLGWCFLQLNEHDKAEYFYNQALKDVNVSVTKNKNIPHYYSLPTIFDLIYLYTSENRFDKAEPYYLMAKKLLNDAGEGDLFNYFKNNEDEALISEEFSGFSWSLDAQISGVHAMIKYMQSQNIIHAQK